MKSIPRHAVRNLPDTYSPDGLPPDNVSWQHDREVQNVPNHEQITPVRPIEDATESPVTPARDNEPRALNLEELIPLIERRPPAAERRRRRAVSPPVHGLSPPRQDLTQRSRALGELHDQLEQEEVVGRPKRSKKLPVRFQGYDMDRD